jgi:hypothetical protein
MNKFIPPKTVYIAGPITGLENNNHQAFKDVQEKLLQLNVNCINPHDLFDGLDTSAFTHDDFMRVCISALSFCDKVVTLPGWENSKGATMEVQIARIMGKEVVYSERFLQNLANAAA